ncbi:MAG TPA: hypothetical protein VFS67_03985 [Polyangiaceae bacterium]|nr:hypothetical protein [Polyangiaceae bacterium]
MKSPVFVGLLALALSALSAPAGACGVSASGVSSCSLAEHLEQARPHWALGASGLYTSTRLRFSGGLYGDETRWAALGVFAWLPAPTLVLQAGLGVAVDGALRLPEGEYDFSPGPIASLGLDWRAWQSGPWFALLTSTLSASFARTQLAGGRAESYSAFDLRLGGQFGVELARRLQPYALARVFGGPVFWKHGGESVSGTDTHHFQLGAGLALRVGARGNLFVEAVPLGETALSAGAGLAF